MFLSDTHLPQLLPPLAYTEQEWFDSEQVRFQLPQWQLATTMAEIPRKGDFITCRILGHDVIVHHTEEGPRAFLNVCPHRMALLTSRPGGHACQLKCQYHGWEFAADGGTRRIPDAPGFRPLEKGAFGLKRFDTDTVGQLVFVRIVSGGPDAASMFGPRLEDVCQAVARHNPIIVSWAREVDANWKVILENNLESYHVGEVHRATLGPMPDEKACVHEFSDRHSAFMAPGGVPGVTGALQRALLRSISRATRGQYTHCLFLPNLTVLWLDDIVAVQTFEPLSPQRTRVTFRGFAVRSSQRAPLRDQLLAWAARRHLLFWGRVWEEDLRLYPDLQAGVMNPQHPGTGLLSRREERIHHFQRWLLDRMGGLGVAADGVAGMVPACRPAGQKGGAA